MTSTKITRQNVEHLLLESIVREQVEALQWINQLESWKRKKLLDGDMRYFHPDRIAETDGWVEVRAEPTRQAHATTDTIQRSADGPAKGQSGCRTGQIGSRVGTDGWQGTANWHCRRVLRGR